MKLLIRKIPFILLAFLMVGCAAKRRARKLEKAKVPVEEQKERRPMEGIKLSKRYNNQLERKIAKVEKGRGERIKMEQDIQAPSTKKRKRKKLQKKYTKSENKDYRQQAKIKKYHKKQFLKAQSRETRRRMKQNQKRANRKLKGKRPDPWYRRIF